MNNIIEWNDRSFERELNKATVPVVVDFYASWCGPCKMLAPVLEGLAVEFGDRLVFAKVNVDAAPRLSMRHAISGVPTLILFHNGLPLDRIVGMPSPGALKTRLEQVAALASPAAKSAA